MSNPLSRLLFDHPREVGESYGEHFVASTRYGLRVAKVAGYCFVHAIFPGLYRSKASDTIRAMAVELGGRAGVARDERMRQAGAWDPGL